MARLHTALSDQLGLVVPIVQAPMAGGPASIELVAAVSQAGGLGSFGFAYTPPEEMKRQAAAVRAKTNGPFGINLFGAPLPSDVPDADQREALSAVAGYYAELGLPHPEPVRAPYGPDFSAQLDAVVDIRPKVFTTHLSALSGVQLGRLKAAGILVGASATCVAEAEMLQSLGFDFVIAQGGEAGGHRGTYLRDPYEAMTGTLALTRLLAKAVRLPVIAAGGIMDGEGIAAVLCLGAQAAQLGTAFIACPESGASQAHKEALLAAREDITTITEKFSGKPARGIANRFTREMQARNALQLVFPAQNSVTAKLRAASAKAGNPDFVAMWAGQGLALSRALPAAALIARLEAEAIEAIRRTANIVKE